MHAIRVLAQMKQGLGDHWAAIRVLTKAIELSSNPERIQCLFLRGALTLPAHRPRGGAGGGARGWQLANDAVNASDWQSIRVQEGGFLVPSHACAFSETLSLHIAQGWGREGREVPRGGGGGGLWCTACVCLVQNTVPAHCSGVGGGGGGLVHHMHVPYQPQCPCTSPWLLLGTEAPIMPDTNHPSLLDVLQSTKGTRL